MELGDELTESILKNYRSAAIDDRLRATLTFLEKMTLAPDSLSPADAEAVRQAGVDDAMLLEAAHVCAAFNMIDRIADTVEFAVPTKAQFRKQGKMLLTRGYR